MQGVGTFSGRPGLERPGEHALQHLIKNPARSPFDFRPQTCDFLYEFERELLRHFE